MPAARFKLEPMVRRHNKSVHEIEALIRAESEPEDEPENKPEVV